MVRRSRYERILGTRSAAHLPLAVAMAQASHHARQEIDVSEPHDRAIRDVAAGVAGPALVAYLLWIFKTVESEPQSRLLFLSRDGQVLHLLARRLATALGWKNDLNYVYSSRRTWSLAASEPEHLADEPWLFDSLVRSNAQDLCARLGIPFLSFLPILEQCHVSLEPEHRSDDVGQFSAFRRFLCQPAVIDAMRPRISGLREQLTDYCRQNGLTGPDAVLVDAGWTGRMVSALGRVLLDGGYVPPRAYFWGYQPKRMDSGSIEIWPYMFDTARQSGLNYRLYDTPFLVETLCMGDHGIVSGYARGEDGYVAPLLASPDNVAAKSWGLSLYRATLMAFCDGLEDTGVLSTRSIVVGEDVRPIINAAMRAFWLTPTRMEARSWGSYIYDSDPTGTAAGPLAKAYTSDEVEHALQTRELQRGGRPWIAGSIALSSPSLRGAYASTVRGEHSLPSLGLPPSH